MNDRETDIRGWGAVGILQQLIRIAWQFSFCMCRVTSKYVAEGKTPSPPLAPAAPICKYLNFKVLDYLAVSPQPVA